MEQLSEPTQSHLSNAVLIVASWLEKWRARERICCRGKKMGSLCSFTFLHRSLHRPRAGGVSRVRTGNQFISRLTEDWGDIAASGSLRKCRTRDSLSSNSPLSTTPCPVLWDSRLISFWHLRQNIPHVPFSLPNSKKWKCNNKLNRIKLNQLPGAGASLCLALHRASKFHFLNGHPLIRSKWHFYFILYIK